VDGGRRREEAGCAGAVNYPRLDAKNRVGTRAHSGHGRPFTFTSSHARLRVRCFLALTTSWTPLSGLRGWYGRHGDSHQRIGYSPWIRIHHMRRHRRPALPLVFYTSFTSSQSLQRYGVERSSETPF
jgi:hypothetical protein